MWDKLKDRLIEDYRYWHKQWSAWLAVLWGLIVTMVFNDPNFFISLMNALPESTRAGLSPFVMIVVSATPIIIRNLKQKNLTG